MSKRQDDDEFTAEELAAIRSLERLGRKWPKTLALMSMNGTLLVIHTSDRSRVAETFAGDGEMLSASIPGITNDGGDWLMDEDEFTAEELAAIKSLQRLARKWPDTLTLLSMEGCIYVTRTADQDVIATRDGWYSDLGVPMLPILGIPNDGGCW
jgi:hypothetical protein